jgi:toxin ParE1/3/4
VWSVPALEDVDSVAGFIARDSEYYAASFVREIVEAAESLSEFADRGQIVPELLDPTIRELLVRPYRLVYRVEPERVEILAVIHGAQRAKRL